MIFDVINASLVAGGEGVPVLPVLLEGLNVRPSVQTLSSQLTGDDDTILVIGHEGGAARIFGFVKEFAPAEIIAISTSTAAQLAVGEAQWFTLIVIQHKNSAAISLLAVPGTVALVAAAAKATFAEILTFMGIDEHAATLGICGDIRFHRSADTVIDIRTEKIRRPWYTFDEKKTGLTKDQADPTTLSAVSGGYVDFPADLTSLSAVTPGNLAIDGGQLPSWPYGGRIDRLEYLAGQTPTGASADITLAAQLDGVLVTGSELNLLLATTALGVAPPTADASATRDFLPGQGLDLEVDLVGTAFTAGSGTVRVHLSRYE